MTAIETVVSPLLTEPPTLPELSPRVIDRDYADTVEAGYVESPDEWIARIGGLR